MLKFILCQGLSGSGKTTWARHWTEEDSIHRIRLNYDDIRCMLGKYWVPEREGFVRYLFKQGLRYAILNGYEIVIDNMNNLNPKHIKEYQDMIETFNKECTFEYTLELKLFNTSLDECIKGDSLREHPIGEEVIKQQWEKYKDYIVNKSKEL